MTGYHHFTVDVEECFHAYALQRWIPEARWAEHPRRSPGVIARLLDRLDEAGARGTFFVVGWLAEREPAMVRAIAERGHELGSHTWRHRLVTAETPESFRASVARTKRLLEDLTGQEVLGFRAPSWSIVPGLEWAFDVLLEEGYRYDASLFPIRHHPDYGYPGAEEDPFWIERPAGRILEVPATTARLIGRTLPAAGGAYFRLLPSALVRAGLRQAQARGRPGTFYIHPWELDRYVPRVRMDRVSRLRTFAGAGGTWRKLSALLEGFAFGRVDATLEAMEEAAPWRR